MRFTIIQEINIAQITISQLLFNKFIKSNQMLVFDGWGKPEYPEKNLLELGPVSRNRAHFL